MTMIRPRANTYSDIVQPQHSCKFVEALHTTAFLQMSRMSASGSLEDESPLRSPAVLRPTDCLRRAVRPFEACACRARSLSRPENNGILAESGFWGDVD